MLTKRTIKRKQFHSEGVCIFKIRRNQTFKKQNETQSQQSVTKLDHLELSFQCIA